jgi:hypothetical protein
MQKCNKDPSALNVGDHEADELGQRSQYPIFQSYFSGGNNSNNNAAAAASSCAAAISKMDLHAHMHGEVSTKVTRRKCIAHDTSSKNCVFSSCLPAIS